MGELRQLSLRSQRSRNGVEHSRPVEVMTEVLLSRPDELDGLFHRHRDDERLFDEVREQPASEPAADEGTMNEDLVRGEAGDLGGNRLGHLDTLRRCPDLATTLGNVRRAVHRLHRGVGLKRNLIRGGVAARDHRNAAPFLQVGEERPGGQFLSENRGQISAAGERASLGGPGQIGRIERATRLPVRPGDDRNPIRERHDLNDARFRPQHRRVVFGETSPETRGPSHSCYQHSRNGYVDAERRAAVHFRGDVPARNRAPIE